MKIVIKIPKEFELHFENDRFADSLARVASDIESLGFKLSGRYECETITMIRKAFENGTPLVNCNNCIWWTKADASLQGRCSMFGIYPTGTWFCANAERKEGAEG